jgi:hypothetical protein
VKGTAAKKAAKSRIRKRLARKARGQVQAGTQARTGSASAIDNTGNMMDIMRRAADASG